MSPNHGGGAIALPPNISGARGHGKLIGGSNFASPNNNLNIRNLRNQLKGKYQLFWMNLIFRRNPRIRCWKKSGDVGQSQLT